jgi:hypothetical protein
VEGRIGSSGFFSFPHFSADDIVARMITETARANKAGTH